MRRGCAGGGGGGGGGGDAKYAGAPQPINSHQATDALQHIKPWDPNIETISIWATQFNNQPDHLHVLVHYEICTTWSGKTS